MSQSQRQLKIGDKVYIKKFGEIASIQTIIKITPTMAKSSSYNFNLDIEENGYVKIKGMDKWNSSSGWIESNELKKEVEDRLLKKWMSDNCHTFTPEQIKKIKEIVNG